jgi:hypothetical protein
MSLADVLDSVSRIEIEPPDDPSTQSSSRKTLVIDSEQAIRQILSPLQFVVSDESAIERCKIPPGFTVRFIAPGATYDADVNVIGHKHLVVKEGGGLGTVHYELPPRFEEAIGRFLDKSLE